MSQAAEGQAEMLSHHVPCMCWGQLFAGCTATTCSKRRSQDEGDQASVACWGQMKPLNTFIKSREKLFPGRIFLSHPILFFTLVDVFQKHPSNLFQLLIFQTSHCEMTAGTSWVLGERSCSGFVSLLLSSQLRFTSDLYLHPGHLFQV